jgi:hypothetical protein
VEGGGWRVEGGGWRVEGGEGGGTEHSIVTWVGRISTITPKARQGQSGKLKNTSSPTNTVN